MKITVGQWLTGWLLFIIIVAVGLFHGWWWVVGIGLLYGFIWWYVPDLLNFPHDDPPEDIR